MTVRVALIGNPNTGKSVVFNNLTGSRQHVGNWPGKTVEKKEGKCTHKGVEMEIVDLPGTYSLTARAIDELIARDYLIEERPDVVVDIVDASNIERNLYLALLLMELEVRLVIALNMLDMAESKGYKIDVEGLSKNLGVQIVPTVATEKRGMEELKDAILQAAEEEEKRHHHIVPSYGEDIEKVITKLTKIVQKDQDLVERYPPRWLAIRILEQDEDALQRVKGTLIEGELLEATR